MTDENGRKETADVRCEASADRKRVRLLVSYDGTNYCGWQIQPNAVTVEEVLTNTLTELLGESVRLIGASRTDSGVHARGNVAVFDTNTKIPADRIAYALNSRLPGDIAVLRSDEVPGDWHPRRQKCIKTYEYRMYTGRERQPLKRLYASHVPYTLDIEKMRAAASCFVGEHDFAGFCAAGASVKTTVRTVYSAQLEREEDEIVFRICGNGFLYNMVRIIVGTLIEIGRGAAGPEAVTGVLESGVRTKANTTAPAAGLVLSGIDYENQMNEAENEGGTA